LTEMNLNVIEDSFQLFYRGRYPFKKSALSWLCNLKPTKFRLKVQPQEYPSKFKVCREQIKKLDCISTENWSRKLLPKTFWCSKVRKREIGKREGREKAERERGKRREEDGKSGVLWRKKL